MNLQGPAGLFCWIVVNSDSKQARIAIIAYYAITWFIIVLNIFFVVRVIILLKRELRGEDHLIRKYTNKLTMYPLVQIICFLPTTANRIYILATNKELFFLWYLNAIFDALTGLMFTLVFGFNSSVRNVLIDCIRKICCKKKNKVQCDLVNKTSDSEDNIDSTIFRNSENSINTDP